MLAPRSLQSGLEVLLLLPDLTVLVYPSAGVGVGVVGGGGGVRVDILFYLRGW
jgi:hypothetical protein